MQRREQLLLGGLLSAVVIWQGSGWVSSAVFGPFQARSEKLRILQKSVVDKEDQLLLLSRARKSLKTAQLSSLPPDAGKSKRPDALNAQRLYLQWLTDISQLCEFEELKVTPDRRFPNGNAYVSVVVKLEAKARYEQLVRFLDLFYRTDLTHRITSLRVTTKEFEGDPLLGVTLEAEGLAMLDAPPRRTLFSQTKLTEELSEDGTEIRVAGLDDFPKQSGFRIRIKNEFLTVAAVDGTNWTVERGIDRTVAASYPRGTLIELVRYKPDQPDRSSDEFSELVATNIFVKPAPPYKLKLVPFGDKPFVRGKPNEFSIGVLGYDTSKGKPEFTIVGTPPPGLKLDKSGKVSWKPGSDVKADKYPLTIEVRHRSSPQSLTETMTIRLRDSTPSPKLAETKPSTVYLNREWSFQPVISAADSPSAKFSWKLGDKSPQGLTIDDKSGEIKWTPGDTVPTGETIVPLVVTDNDTPPQSTTLSLKLDIRDDEASFTRLDTIFKIGDSKRAFLYDPSKNKKTELHEGDVFAVADLSGTVKQIGRKHVIMTLDQRDIRLDVGQSLREAQAKSKDYEQ